MGAVVGLVLLGAYLFDHPRILRSVDGIKVTLDKIDPDALSDPAKMRSALSARLGVQVMSYQIVALNYITRHGANQRVLSQNKTYSCT